MTENQPHDPAPGTVGAEAFRRMGEYAQSEAERVAAEAEDAGGPPGTTANRRLSWKPEAGQ